MTGSEENSVGDVKRARRPLSYAEAPDREPCEGRTASLSSPSNPTPFVPNGSHQADSPIAPKPIGSKAGELDAVVVFRCRAHEKQQLIDKAAKAGMSFAELMREALGLVDARRRKPRPKADPELIRAVSRIGGNVNQIARWLNSATASGNVSTIDAVTIITELVSLDRRLGHLISQNCDDASPAHQPGEDEPSC